MAPPVDHLQQCGKLGCGRFWYKHAFTTSRNRSVKQCPRCRGDRGIPTSYWLPDPQDGSPSGGGYSWPSEQPLPEVGHGQAEVRPGPPAQSSFSSSQLVQPPPDFQAMWRQAQGVNLLPPGGSSAPASASGSSRSAQSLGPPIQQSLPSSSTQPGALSHEPSPASFPPPRHWPSAAPSPSQASAGFWTQTPAVNIQASESTLDLGQSLPLASRPSSSAASTYTLAPEGVGVEPPLFLEPPANIPEPPSRRSSFSVPGTYFTGSATVLGRPASARLGPIGSSPEKPHQTDPSVHQQPPASTSQTLSSSLIIPTSFPRIPSPSFRPGEISATPFFTAPAGRSVSPQLPELAYPSDLLARRRGSNSPRLYVSSSFSGQQSPTSTSSSSSKRSISRDAMEGARRNSPSTPVGNNRPVKCSICDNLRSANLIDSNTVCVYCVEMHEDEEEQERYCPCCKEMRSGAYFTANGPTVICTFCQDPASPTTQDWDEILASTRRPRSRSSSVSTVMSQRRTDHLVDQRDPDLRPDGPVLTDEDDQRLSNFSSAMMTVTQDTCHVCKRHWFDMDLQHGTCQECRRRDRNQSISFYGGANYLSIGASVQGLPTLTLLEEMSIARVQGILEIWTVQAGKSGRVTSFLLEEARIYDVLPVPISDLGVIVVRPDTTNGTNVDAQFLGDTLYRRDAVRIWLQYLIQHHPGYSGVTINDNHLNGLMAARHEFYNLPTEIVEGNIQVRIPVLPPIRTSKPTLLSRHQFASLAPRQNQTYLTVPIEDMNTKRPFLSWVFPTIYPNGQAEYCRPRPRSIKFADYISHLMRQQDARFINHPQWLYVCFNLLLSQQIQGRTKYLASRLPKNLTVDDIQQAIAQTEDSPLLKYLVNDLRVLRGLRSFWQMKRKQLKSQVDALGYPHLFFTLTAAMSQWDTLARLLPGVSPLSTQHEINTAVIKNPHIAVHHFVKRRELFMSLVFRPKFDVLDWWGRYEYQANGTVHFHGLSWHNNAPPYRRSGFPGDDQDILDQTLVDFWDPHITAMNPRSILPTSSLTTLVNTVQMHQHTAGCRFPDNKCRYGFPEPVRAQARLGMNQNGRLIMFKPRRNDPNLNQFNRAVTLGWQANTDLQPMTESSQAIDYVAKDVTNTKHYSGNELTAVTNSNNPRVMLAASVVRHASDQKEYFGQEICQQLLDIPLVDSSRGVVIIDCRRVEDQSEVRGKTLLTRYLERDPAHERLNLLDFATAYDYKGSMAPLPKRRIPMFIPKFAMNEQDEDYCRAKMMLRHSFRHSVDDMLTRFPPHVFNNFVDLFRFCQNNHTSHSSMFDTLSTPDFRHTDFQDVLVNDDWKNLLEQLGDTPFESDLGRRPVDVAHIWPVGTHALDRAFWINIPQRPLMSAHLIGPDAANTLNQEQVRVHYKVIQHFQQMFNGSDVEPFRAQLDGVGGTGKTYLINVISHHLESLAGHMNLGNPVLRIAPTAAAAFEILGSTIHTALRIPVGRAFQDLSDDECNQLKQDYASVELIIMDEKSMIDLVLLHHVDARCRQLWDSDQPFGGKCVILAGDFAQLPPVRGKPLYVNRGHDEFEAEGYEVYLGFRHTAKLTQIVRQNNDAVFQRILSEVRDSNVTDASCDLLASRSMSLLSLNEIGSFDDAIRIYNTNLQVDQLNQSRLRSTNLPVLRIDATGTGVDWNKAQDDRAGGLETSLHLSIGTRVMLLDNLSTSNGAKNGATGIVRHIEFAAGDTPRVDMPRAILVELDRYNGPTMTIAGGYNVVPIFPVTRRYMYKGNHCTRTQFPLTVAYAITVHSSQGATIDGKAVFDISRRDWAQGLTYTALSRVKQLDNIMLEIPFGRERFAATTAEALETSHLRQRKLDELHRSQQPW